MTEAITLPAIKVQRAVGPGVVEDVYKVCLAHGLRPDGHHVLREVYLDLTCEGLCVPNACKMDLVVDDKVVVEAKAIEKGSDASFARLNTYRRPESEMIVRKAHRRMRDILQGTCTR